MIMLRMIYRGVPSLAVKERPEESDSPLSHPLTALYTGLSEYFAHRVAPSSLTYVLLYITVLSGGVSIVSYLNSIGVEPFWIALFSAGASIMGIASTWIVVPVLNCLGNIRAGQVFLAMQLFYLSISVVAFFVFSDEFSSIRIITFLLGVIFSRTGLWGFDMVEVQQIQIFVEPYRRGIFNATESALTNLAYIVILGLGLILNHPSQFKWLVITSVSCVVFANCLYFFWWQLSLRGQNNIKNVHHPSNALLEEDFHVRDDIEQDELDHN